MEREKPIEKGRLPLFSVSPTILSVTTTCIIFYLSLPVPFGATISFDFFSFDRETKLTCSPAQKGICLQGDAFLSQGLQLTKNQLRIPITSSVGRAVFSQPVHIWDSITGRMADFTTHFSFIIHDVDPLNPPGDGFAFFLSPHPSKIPENSAGGLLGLFPNSSFRDGQAKLVAVEFDTYPNSELDTSSADHIGINVNSIRSVVDSTLDGGIKKGAMAEAWVEYNASMQTLSVAVAYGEDHVSRRNFDLSYAADLREVLPEYVSIGFSAATGSLVETHAILSWSFHSNLDARGTTMLLILKIIVAGALMVFGMVMVWFIMYNKRKSGMVKGVENNSKYASLTSEGTNADDGHLEEMAEKEEHMGVGTMLMEETGQGLLKDGDIGVDGISLVDRGGCQTEIMNPQSGLITEQDGRWEQQDSNLDGECTAEDGNEMMSTKTVAIIDVIQVSNSREGGTDVEIYESDADLVVEEGGSDKEVLVPTDLLERGSSKEIPYDVLARSTNNFSEDMVIGKGGFGPVYKGFLSDLGLDIAIKKLSQSSQQGMSEFTAEVKIISQLRHRNLVKLIGWCHDNGELMLVYEFMPNGSLDHHLFRENSLLEWPVRYKIALGLANALMYLHDECEPYVLHRDVKSSNVLLDFKLDAKLADFGLAKMFNTDISSLRVTHPAGTRGYWAPEYALMSKASRKSDVYSFGVVALEIACGKKAIQMMQGEDGDSYATLLVEWVWDLYGKGAILDAADKRLKGDFDHVQMQRLLMVGLWCAHPDHRQRPSVRQASNTLLFPETTPLPCLPAEVPPWAYPLAFGMMQTMQPSPMPLASHTSPRGIDTLPRTRVSKEGKHRIFPRFTWWLKKRKATISDGILDDDSIRMLTAAGLEAFSYQELVQATNNFSGTMKLGEEGFGPTYKGRLSSGMVVAVKKFSFRSFSCKREYAAELTTLGCLGHKNLVKLIGWCHEPGRYILVFETYMTNGSLDQHLFGGRSTSTIPWEVRYKVALSLASALCYLHNDWECCVLHKDIKTSAMFLDEEFNMKLGDFSLARRTDHGAPLETTRVAGTIGYMAPEYAQYGKYTTASDVYSFGVVALEIACGKRDWEGDPSLGYETLTEHIRRCYARGNLVEASDEKLMGNFDSGEMERLMVVGLCCTHIDPAQRLPMATVLRILRFEEDLPACVATTGDRLPASLSRTTSVASYDFDSDGYQDGR